MIVTTLTCRNCRSAALVKNGTTKAGRQRVQCKDCGKTLALNPKSRVVTSEKEALIERLLEERTTIRGIRRVVKCGTQIVYRTLKKVETMAWCAAHLCLPPLEESVLPAYKRGEQGERFGVL